MLNVPLIPSLANPLPTSPTHTAHRVACIICSGGFITYAGLPTFSTATTSSWTTALAQGGGLNTIPPITSTATISQTMSIPQKILKRIRELDYIEMAELVPDNWRYGEEEQKCCHQTRRSQRRGPVSDILLWIECYSSLVSVLGAYHPAKIADLMAYQCTIVKAHKTFVGEGWITYDSCYRRKAAIIKSLDWGQVDFTLYNETFTGRAKAIPRCRHCSSEHHVSANCSYAPEIPPAPVRYGSTPPIPRQRYESSRYYDRSTPKRPLCLLFNSKYGDRCTFKPCKFAHQCKECSLFHPIASCPDLKLNSPHQKIPRGDSPAQPRK